MASAVPASWSTVRPAEAVSSATFDSRGAMDRNQENARELRNARTRELGADILDVGEFDLALAHLRLPEMA